MSQIVAWKVGHIAGLHLEVREHGQISLMIPELFRVWDRRVVISRVIQHHKVFRPAFQACF